APLLRRSAPRPKHRARITATSQSAGRTGQAAHKDGRRLVTSRSGHDIRRRGRFLVGFLVGSALFTLRTAFGRRQFFIRPQAPGGRIRALGFPRISSGARSRLPPLRVGLALLLRDSYDTHQTERSEARPTGRRALLARSQAGGCPRPALEV